MKSKKIACLGFLAFIGIILFSTAIFNWFWTGTGESSSRSFYAPFTNDFNEFKEYAALYIALLSCCATAFAGFAVFLVFNDWKDQHNKTVIAEEAKSLLIAINDDIEVITSISGTLRNKNRSLLVHEIYDEIATRTKKINENNYKISSKALVLYELNDDEKLKEIRDKYDKNMIELQRKILLHLESNSNVGCMIDMFDEILPKFMHNNKVYKRKVRSYILAE